MENAAWSLLALCAIVGTLLTAHRFFNASLTSTNGPQVPGPKGPVYIGVAPKLPRLGTWFAMKSWGDQFGPLVKATVMGSTWILITNMRVAQDLLSKRSSIYSSRPAIPSVVDSRSDHGSAEYVPLMALNIDHTRHKKFDKSIMEIARSRSYDGIPVSESRRLLRKMANEAGNKTAWVSLTEEFAARVLCTLAFGDPQHESELRQHTQIFLEYISPSASLASMVRQLSVLPYWLNPWKQAEFHRHDSQQKFFQRILREVKEKLRDNAEKVPESYIKTFVQSKQRDHELGKESIISTDREAAAAIGIIATASILTTSSPLQSFIRALSSFPELVVRIQREIDAVVPATRMPDMSDMPSLPYLRACLRETTRWRPPIPAGIPHELDQNDEYQGYLLEKGSAIFWVDYALCRDPEYYPRPYEFLPERWLDPAYPTTYRDDLKVYPRVAGSTMFGWGRRQCLGQDIAEKELYMAAAHMLWAFNLSPTARGQEQLSAHLAPGEARGGMQQPQSWEQSLILVKPEDLEVQWTWRDEDRRKLVMSQDVGAC